MTSILSVEGIFYIAMMGTFGILGSVTLYRSFVRNVRNIAWMGAALAIYAGYYGLIILNLLEWMPRELGFVLEIVFFIIIFSLLAFTKFTFYNKRARPWFIAIAVVVGIVGVASCTLAALGDTSLPYNGIHDASDAWRYALDDFIVGPVIFISMFISGVRTYRRMQSSLAIARRRILLFTASNVAITSLWVLNFLGSFSLGIGYVIYTIATGICATAYVVTMCMGWLSPGATMQQSIDLSSVGQIAGAAGIEHVHAVTNIAVFKVLEIMGTELASLINKTAAACKGLLLLVILKQLGEESLARLDLALLPGVLTGGLRSMLGELGVHDPDAVVTSLHAFVIKNYDVFSFQLY